MPDKIKIPCPECGGDLIDPDSGVKGGYYVCAMCKDLVSYEEAAKNALEKYDRVQAEIVCLENRKAALYEAVLKARCDLAFCLKKRS